MGERWGQATQNTLYYKLCVGVCVYQRGNKYYTKVHALSVLAFFKKDGFSILTPFLGNVHCCICNVCTALSESEGKTLLCLYEGFAFGNFLPSLKM